MLLYLPIQNGEKKACMAALMWIWQQQWICNGRITINLFFCRNILGIDKCKEEKRLLQSLAVRGFLTSLCVSIFLLVERYEKKEEQSQGGQRRDSPLKKALSRLSAGYKEIGQRCDKWSRCQYHDRVLADSVYSVFISFRIRLSKSESEAEIPLLVSQTGIFVRHSSQGQFNIAIHNNNSKK